MDPRQAAAGPVAELRVRARLEHERAEERIAGNKASLDEEVAPERRLGSRLSDSHDAAQQDPVVGDAANDDAALADAHDDPVPNQMQVQELPVGPASLPVRPAGQAQLVPPASVRRSAGGDRQHDGELLIGPEAMQE